MKTLYVIDGYAQFFRAYHAIRTPLTSPVTKEPTNMTFGFVGMLLKLLRGEGALGGRPDYVLVALDVSGDTETFRSEIYPEYKAHRPPPPEDLFPQVDRCVALLREMGVPTPGAAGFEADDVIATIVDRVRRDRPDVLIRIVSKDKDLKQLLVPGSVEMFDIHTDQPFTAESLLAEIGLAPSQVVDLLTLTGDTADNVPGVPGVGEKTAAQLIREYGSVDALLAKAAEVKGKRGENLRAAAPLLPLSRTLVTLRRDVPLSESDPLAGAAVSGLRLDMLMPRLKELGFNRYQDDLRAIIGGPGAPPARPTPVAPSAPAGTLFDALGGPVAPGATAPDGDYRAITDLPSLVALGERIRGEGFVAFDTETTSLVARDARLCGVSLCVRAGEAFYVPVRSPEPSVHLSEAEALGVLGPMLEDRRIAKIGHNVKFDVLALRGAGVRVRGFASPGACDTMVASYLLDSSRSSHSLDALAMAMLGRGKQSISELIGSGKAQRTFDTVPVELATPYAAADADLALRLSQKMLPALEAAGLSPLFVGVELPLVDVLAELEWNGIRVDPAELERQRVRLQSRIDVLLRELADRSFEAIGRSFDPDSPRQLAAALFNRTDAPERGLGIRPVKRTKTGYSTDAEVLEKLGGDETISTPIPGLILEYRQLTKLVSTYLVALRDAIHPATGRVHAGFHQTIAATGRLSSSDPNLQNIPIRTDIGREIRRAFVAPPGRTLVTADYSQIELRLLAHISKDPALIEAFRGGADIHTEVAAQIHAVPPEKVTREQRNGAKMVNFGIVYGITSYGLARRLGIGEKAAAEIIAGYKKRFAGITTTLEECVAQARRFGYVETMLKRRRPIPEIDSRNPQTRAFAERTAINSVVQGSAADLIKLAMVDLHRRLSPSPDSRDGPPELPGVLMLLQIHDELVFEAPIDRAEEVRALVVDRMERAMELAVPIRAEARIAPNWFDGK